MLELTTRAISAWLLLAVLASFALANPVVSGKDGGPTSVFAYSSDSQLATFQWQAKRVVERYQDGLNTSDFPVIRTLFAGQCGGGMEREGHCCRSRCDGWPLRRTFQDDEVHNRLPVRCGRPSWRHCYCPDPSSYRADGVEPQGWLQEARYEPRDFRLKAVRFRLGDHSVYVHHAATAGRTVIAGNQVEE
jgi:hypothetical protein